MRHCLAHHNIAISDIGDQQTPTGYPILGVNSLQKLVYLSQLFE